MLDRNSPGGLWFGVERAIINPVVDSLFYHVVKHEGRSWPHYGRFIRLDRDPLNGGGIMKRVIAAGSLVVAWLTGFAPMSAQLPGGSAEQCRPDTQRPRCT